MKGVFEKVAGSGIWWIRFADGKYPNGTSRIRYEKCGSHSTAEKTLTTRKNTVLQGEKLPADKPKATVGEIIDAVVADYAKNKHRSARHLKCRLKHIRPHFGQMKANAVGTKQLDDYIEKRQNAGAENGTINRELSALRRAYTLAYEASPRRVDEVPKITKLEENAAREGFVEDEHFDALKNAADELWLKALLVTAYDFGFRRGELLNLKVRQISLKQRKIELPAVSTKNKTPRNVVMTDQVYDFLKQCVAGKGADDFVFTRSGKPVLDFRGAWWTLCEKAGLGKFVGKEWRGLLFHDLRRSAARNFVRAGVSEKVVMQITGHKSRSVFDRYNVTSEKDLAEAATKLQESRTESKTEVAAQRESKKSVKAA
jgi:integrase